MTCVHTQIFCIFALASNLFFLPVVSSAQNVGIGTPTPGSHLSVRGSMVVGQTFAWWAPTATPSTLIIEGKTGIGTPVPVYQLEVDARNQGQQALLVQSSTHVQVFLESASQHRTRLCFSQNDSLRFCWIGDTLFLRLIPYSPTNQQPLPPALWIRRADGFIGLGTAPGAIRLTLPNVPFPSGQGLATAWIQVSDHRFKTHIHLLTDSEALSILTELRPVIFTWKGTRVTGTGFLAQDLQHVLPGAVVSLDNGTGGVDYFALIPVLIRVVQWQEYRLQELRKMVKTLQKIQEPCFSTSSDPAREQ